MNYCFECKGYLTKISEIGIIVYACYDPECGRYGLLTTVSLPNKTFLGEKKD